MRQIAIFISRRDRAACTHLAVATAAVELFGLPPLTANVIGFGIAFLVSFEGHARWTFRFRPGARMRQPARGFFCGAHRLRS